MSFVCRCSLERDALLCDSLYSGFRESNEKKGRHSLFFNSSFAPWCPACKALGPIWKEFSAWSKDLGVKVAHVDVTANPGLSGRFMVTALPTMYHVKDGVFRQYRGSRDKESFINFVEEKRWQTVEPISSWKSPQSIQMSLVAQFFKLSMAVRVGVIDSDVCLFLLCSSVSEVGK